MSTTRRRRRKRKREEVVLVCVRVRKTKKKNEMAPLHPRGIYVKLFVCFVLLFQIFFAWKVPNPLPLALVRGALKPYPTFTVRVYPCLCHWWDPSPVFVQILR